MGTDRRYASRTPPPAARLGLALAIMGIGFVGLITQTSFQTALNLQSQALVWSGYAFVLYGLLFQGWGQTPPERGLLLLAAIGLRLVLITHLPPESRGSDDLYRYVWEGRVTGAGLNPYRWAPHSEWLASFVDPSQPERFTNIRYPSLPSPYPPLAQWVFSVGARLTHPALWGFKLIYWPFDVLLLAATASLLARAGQSPRRLWIVALNPLLLREAYYYGHYDLVPTALLTGGTVLLTGASPRAVGGGAMLGLAAGTRLFPLMVLPLFLRRLGVRGALALMATVALPIGPLWWGAGDDPVGRTQRCVAGMEAFLTHLRLNASPVSDWLLYALRRFIPTASAPNLWLNRLSFLLVLGVMVVLGRRARDDRKLMEGLFWGMTAMLVLSRFANPWYFLWMVPWLALRPSPAWMGLMALSILVHVRGEGQEIAPAMRYLEWMPFLLGIALEGRRQWRTGRWPFEGCEGTHWDSAVEGSPPRTRV